MTTISSQYENDLLTRFAAGDERAYDHIFRLLYKPLCFFAYKILSDQAGAEDLVQDALLKCWQRRSSFESMAKIRAFLYVSVRNACLDALEHQKVVRKHEQLLASHPAITEQHMLDTIMQAEVVARVFEMVDTLPEQCRKVIKMTFEEGKSAKEIADELGVTPSTVSNQKMRGLILLKKRLSDKDLALIVCFFLPELIR